MPTPITKQRVDQLVDNDFIRYNNFQDYSLKPNDFNDAKTFEEFALRFASTQDLFVRDKFSSAMSRQLKIALCWELFLIYKNSDESDIFARNDIPAILKRDFKLDVKKITDKQSIENKFMRFSYFFGADGGVDTTNDAPQKIETTYFNYDAYAGGSRSFLLFGDYLLVDPSLTAIFMHMLAEQTIDGVKESINSVGWKLKPALSLSDREYEKWNLWGNGFAKKRYNGFKDSNVWDIEANSGASIDHPFDVPFALNTNLKLVRKIFNPPSVEGTNHRDIT